MGTGKMYLHIPPVFVEICCLHNQNPTNRGGVFKCISPVLKFLLRRYYGVLLFIVFKGKVLLLPSLSTIAITYWGKLSNIFIISEFEN